MDAEEPVALTQPEFVAPVKKTRGRKPGTPNKRTPIRQTVHDKCAEVGIDPIKALARYAANLDPVTGGPAFHYVVRGKGAEAVAVKVDGHSQDIQFAATKELANYVAPKLKAVEHTSQWGGGGTKPPDIHIHFVDVQQIVETSKVPLTLNGNTV